MTTGLHLVLFSLFPLALVAAAVRDATSYTIPNWLCAALIVAFFPTAFALGLSLPAVGVSLGVGAAALAAGIAMFALGWLGGGDAKLFAAAALWLGLTGLGPFLACTGLAGGALAVGLLLIRRAPIAAYLSGPAWVGRLLQPKGDVPYGVAIAVGALAAFPSSLVFHALAAAGRA